MDPITSTKVECIQIKGDFTDRKSIFQIAQHLKINDNQITAVDAVLSDIAPNTSGLQMLDHGIIVVNFFKDF
jgi:23S rRNA U2552 (ribose-2'-O)-methylase RlmE/FtsJ